MTPETKRNILFRALDELALYPCFIPNTKQAIGVVKEAISILSEIPTNSRTACDRLSIGFLIVGNVVSASERIESSLSNLDYPILSTHTDIY